MEVNAGDVMKLRGRTGMQMMKCKAALIEAGGDMEKAVEILRKQNKEARDKLDARETAEGRIGIFIDPAAKVGGIIELRCESAPVAKNEMFVTLTNDLARQVALKGNGATVADFLAQPLVAEAGKTVNDRIGEVVGLMRENVKPARMARLEGTLGQYVHHDGTVGVLLLVEGNGDARLLRDVCMHVAAKSPMAALREQVPRERIAKEMEIARSQALEQGKNKPANIIEKIAEGKVKTWFAENVLAEQPFVKDESKTVGELLKAAGLKIKRFVRYRVGEVTG
jgi:elongation factor Ts